MTETATTKKKGGCLKVAAIIAAVFVGLIILVAVATSGGSGTTSTGGPTQTQTQIENEEAVPVEHRNALRQAKTYANVLHMSKQGVYDQLTSEHGGQFSDEAARYAADNVEADWNRNALEKAKTYQSQMAMSRGQIRDQLVSPHGEKFTEAEADYAMANL